MVDSPCFTSFGSFIFQGRTGSGCNCLTDGWGLQFLHATVSSRKTFNASGTAASAFFLFNRRNCWLTSAADLIASFSASHSCDPTA